MKKKQLYFILLFLGVGSLFSFSESIEKELVDDTFIVVLDAGHGGHDPGNLGNGYLEKNIALNIVLKVGEILSKNKNIKVIYTRKDDTFVDLYARGEIANKANADLFVSVHCDSHTSDAHGAGTFVLGLHANKQNFDIAKKENSAIYLEDDYETKYAEYDINSPESVIGLTIMQEEFLNQSIMLAKEIQNNFSGKLKRQDRKVKQAGFIVLHQTFMPSVLVEAGFLTNKSEGAYLNSGNGQSEMGSAIAEAILSYKKSLNISPSKAEDKIVKSTPKKKPLKKESKKEESKKEVEKPIVKNTPKETTPAPVKIVTTEKEEPKKEVKPAPVVKKEEIKTPPVSKTNIIFKVQILASSKNIPLISGNFKGLNKLSKEPYNNLYRYLYGNTTSYTQAKLLKSNADVKGYTTSYIVAYKDKQRIPIKEALKYVSE